MKILLIGDAGSVFTINFTKALKKNYSQVMVAVINTNAEYVNNDTLNLYDAFFCGTPEIGKLVKKIPVVNRIVRRRKHSKYFKQFAKKTIDDFDVVLLQGFWIDTLKIVKFFDFNNTRLVGAFWGSDFYRREKKSDSLLQKVLNLCEAVIISTEAMQADIQRELRIETQRIHNVLFGVQPMQNLWDMQSLSRNDAKSKLGLSNGTLLITCGSNGKAQMNHMAIIDGVFLSKKALPSEYLLLLPMAYGANVEYIREVEAKLENAGLKYKIIDKFLSDEEVAFLRKATDIFIQIQTTDANSGSMREHLFSQNIVITGSWLPYSSLQKQGLYFESIASPKDLGCVLEKVIINLDSLYEVAKRDNIPEKFRSSLWNECIIGWYIVLKDSFRRMK